MDTEDTLRELFRHLAFATADHGHAWIDANVQKVLKLLRERMAMDVVFVSRFADGRRHFDAVDAAEGKEVIAVGASDPLEESWCQRVVQARLAQAVQDCGPLIAAGEVPHTPLKIGTHLSVPIVLDDGHVYGTLCTFTLDRVQPLDGRELQQLRAASEVIARRIGAR